MQRGKARIACDSGEPHVLDVPGVLFLAVALLTYRPNHDGDNHVVTSGCYEELLVATSKEHSAQKT